jgi:hypothetical protein
VGESIVAGLFQSAAVVTDFRLRGSVNAVHAGDRSYSLSKMNGFQNYIWLRDNVKAYKDTDISEVEGVPQGVMDFVNEYHDQMAYLLGVDPATFEPTVHQVLFFWGHIVESKCRDLGIGIFSPTLLPIADKDYTLKNGQVIKIGQRFLNWGQVRTTRADYHAMGANSAKARGSTT